MKQCLSLLICFFLVLTLLSPLSTSAEENTAENISGQNIVTGSSGFPSLGSLFDSKRYNGWNTADEASLTLSHENGIGSLYLTFGKTYEPYTITNDDTGETITAGEQSYYHDFVNLTEVFGTTPKTVTLTFSSGPVALYELQVYGPGPVPDSIQKWQEPVDGKTDLVLFSTHSDDDQLFFAGLLPYYAVERGYQVQVVYLTSHFNTAPFRIHEVLDGLWAVGIRTYPVFGPFPDFGDTYTVEQAFYRFQRWGYSREDMTGFVVEQLRRFKPFVAVSHDFNGEYGHTQHKVYAQLVADAVAVSQDPEAYPDSAETYGAWDVPKTYVHLYEENPIVMNWDIPMENFDGMTPYQVTKELGFPKHSSQQKGWGYFFRGHDTCADIPHYNPSFYGLYRNTVGEDVQKNDMFENLICHTDQARIAAEEEARLKAEEEARRASEEARLQAEEEARQASEEARKASEEAARQEETTQQTPSEPVPVPEKVPAEELPPLWLPLLIDAALLLILIWLLRLLRRSRRSSGKYKKKKR